MTNYQAYYDAARELIQKDQLENFIAGGYVAQPKALEFHAAARECDLPNGPVEVASAGGRNSGKSHSVICQILDDDCVRFPGLKWLFLRKVGRAAAESFEDLLMKATPHLYDYYTPSKSKIELPNGSRVLLGGYRTEGDIDKYIGIEYDGLCVEEANLLSKSTLDKLYGSVRSTKWRSRKYLTYNPGGIGHAHLKTKFYDPWVSGEETDTRFIFSSVKDNAFATKEYIKYLEGLSGWLKDAWLDGNFEISIGMYFTNWRKDTHVVDEVPYIVPGATVWLSMDYGFAHYTVFLLHTMTNEGVIYTIDEHAERKMLPSQHAQSVLQMLARYGLQPHHLDAIVAGGDVFSKDRDGKCPADDYKQFGLELQRADMSRVAGASEILTRLGNDIVAPTWFISRRCHRLIDTLPKMLHNPNRLEDVLKVDCDDDGVGGDDPYDAARYGLMYSPLPLNYGWGESPLAGYRG